jgi:hypothetical protein
MDKYDKLLEQSQGYYTQSLIRDLCQAVRELREMIDGDDVTIMDQAQEIEKLRTKLELAKLFVENHLHPRIMPSFLDAIEGGKR